MASRSRALSAKEVTAIKAMGLHGVAENLALQNKPNGARSWIFRGRINGKEVQRGLGALRHVSYAEAKARTEEIRVSLRNGVDPFAERAKVKEAQRAIATTNVPTFAWCAEGIVRLKWLEPGRAAL